jgi:serine/threonine protein kinase
VILSNSPFAEVLRDRYVLERELGRGGMATVYLAHDLKHDRPVALKVLRRDLGAVLGAERFLREIRLTANLQHSHILEIKRAVQCLSSADSRSSFEPPPQVLSFLCSASAAATRWVRPPA